MKKEDPELLAEYEFELREFKRKNGHPAEEE